MKRNLLLLAVFAILASCSYKGENGNANGSSYPLKKVAEAVLLCEGAPLERSVGQELAQKISDKNHQLESEKNEIIGAEISTEGNADFCVALDSALKVKSLEPGYGRQYAHVELEAIIKMTSEVPSQVNYVAIGYDGDKPCVMFQFQSQKWMKGNKADQFAQERAEGDRLRLSRKITIDLANAKLYASVTKFIITVENDPVIPEVEEIMDYEMSAYCQKYGR